MIFLRAVVTLTLVTVLTGSHLTRPVDGATLTRCVSDESVVTERVQWQLRDVWRLKITGNTTFSEDQLQSALALDGATQQVVDIARPLAEFCQLVSDRLVAGYQQSGFHEVTCQTVYDEQQQCIRVTLSEGPRYRCGAVVISGSNDRALIETIERALTTRAVQLSGASQQSSAIATNHTGVGTSQISVAIWEATAFANFSENARTYIADRIVALLKEQGYGFAEVKVQFEPEITTKTAKLLVDFSRIGSPQPVREIQFQGLNRHSPEQLLEVLGLPDGPLYDTHQLRQQITQSLLGTGRFVHVAVISETPFDAEQPVTLFVQLREYEHVPKLSESLSPVMEAGMKLTQWLNRWEESGSDLRLVMRISSGETPIDLSQIGKAVGGSVGGEVTKNSSSLDLRDIDVEFITAPGEGGLIRIEADNSNGERLVDYSVLLTRQQAGIVSWRTNRKWTMRDPTVGVIQSMQLTGMPENVDGRNFRLLGGFGFNSASGQSVAPVSARIHADPAAVLDLLVRPDIKTSTQISNGVCTCIGDGWMIEFDSESGALRTLSSESSGPEGAGLLRITAEPGLLARRLAEVSKESSQMEDFGSTADGWESLLTFAAKETLFLCEQFSDQTSPILLAVLKNQAALGEVADQLEAVTTRVHFQIPADTKRSNLSPVGTNWILTIARSLLPSGTMPHRLSSALMLASEQQEVRPLMRLVSEIERDPENGPLTCLLTATLVDTERARLARVGLTRLDTAAAVSEVRMLLNEPGVIRGFLFDAVDLIQKLPEDQLQLLLISANAALSTPATDEQPSKPGFDITPLVMLVRNHPSDDPLEIVVTVYSTVWTVAGRSLAEGILQNYAGQGQAIKVLQSPDSSTPLR